MNNIKQITIIFLTTCEIYLLYTYIINISRLDSAHKQNFFNIQTALSSMLANSLVKGIFSI